MFLSTLWTQFSWLFDVQDSEVNFFCGFGLTTETRLEEHGGRVLELGGNHYYKGWAPYSISLQISACLLACTPGYAKVLREVPPLPIHHHGPWSCLFSFFLTQTLPQLPLYRISSWDSDGPDGISSFLDLPGGPCCAVHSSPPQICLWHLQAGTLSESDWGADHILTLSHLILPPTPWHHLIALDTGLVLAIGSLTLFSLLFVPAQLWNVSIASLLCSRPLFPPSLFSNWNFYWKSWFLNLYWNAKDIW